MGGAWGAHGKGLHGNIDVDCVVVISLSHHGPSLYHLFLPAQYRFLVKMEDGRKVSFWDLYK